MGLEGVQEEIEKAKDLEMWAKRCTTHFTKKVKRKLFEAIDNMAWSGDEEKVSQWCKKNKVFDEITEEEIEDIWNRESPDEEPIRLNGKYVWETAKKVCGFINAHEDLIHITTFGEYKEVMKKVMRVIKESHNTEKKRRQTARKKKCDEGKARTQKAKSLIAALRQGRVRKEDIVRRFEDIFGKGSGQEIENEATNESTVMRIEEVAKREAQFDEWEKMRQDAKRRQREDRRLNLFWRRNKTFPTQFGGDDEFPDADETLEFWRRINNKEVSEGWNEDMDIREVLGETRRRIESGRRCRWVEFTKEEFDEVLRCTAPWKACGVDSVYSFPIKRCPPIKKAVYELVKSLVEWKVTDRWDEENNWLLEGRTVLIFKGGDQKDPANYRPITCLPTITKMVTLAIHKRMQRYLFGNGERSILELEQRGVRTSQGCKEAVIENVASNLMNRREKKEVVELYYDFQKAYDNVNHAYLEKLLEVYGFPPGVQMLIIEMMARWKIRLSYRSKEGGGRSPSDQRHHSG